MRIRIQFPKVLQSIKDKKKANNPTKERMKLFSNPFKFDNSNTRNDFDIK